MRLTLPQTEPWGKRVPRVVVGGFFGIMRGGLDAQQQPRVVVIDGPAGAGKSTIARELARRLGLSMLDTGAIYRTLALAASRAGVDWRDEAGLAALCEDFPIAFESGSDAQRVLLSGEDVSEEIRTEPISAGASVVSAHPAVRARLLGIQRKLGEAGCVAEGRDMGTVVFPDATHKFFVTASPLVRATRRRDERLARGDHDVPSVDAVRRDIEARDLRDRTRDAAPLTQAEDAVLVDTSAMGPEAVIEHMLALVLGSNI
ncbi:MAG: (d)CMP kinase [Myxococcota bacterium]